MQSQLTVSGGRSRCPLAVESKPVETLDGELHFVRVDKNMPWVLQAALGKGSQRGALKRSLLLSNLRKQASRLAAEEPAVAGGPAVADLDEAPKEADLMEGLEDVADHEPTPPAQAKKKRRAHRPRSGHHGQARTLEVPEWEPTCNPDCHERREVKVILQTTNSLWLEAGAIPWMLRWLRDEHASGGVPGPEDGPKELEPNCSVPGVHVRWDFDGGWEALVLSGPLTGRTITSKVHKLTEAKWDLAAARHQINATFGEADQSQRKTATKHYLEHCVAHQVEVAADSQ